MQKLFMLVLIVGAVFLNAEQNRWDKETKGLDEFFQEFELAINQEDFEKIIDMVSSGCVDKSFGCAFMAIFIMDSGEHNDAELNDDYKKFYDSVEKILGSSSQIVSYLKKECSNKNSWACLGLGYYHRGTKKYKEAKNFFEKADNLGNIVAHYELGDLYINGLGVRQSANTAIKYYSDVCNAGGARACHEIGRIYRRGDDGPDKIKKDWEKAREWFGKACDLGDQSGCDEYKK